MAAVFEIGKTEHPRHEFFLLVVYSRHSQEEPARPCFSQKQVAESLKAVLEETVALKGTVRGMQTAEILRRYFPAFRKLSVFKRIIIPLRRPAAGFLRFHFRSGSGACFFLRICFFSRLSCVFFRRFRDSLRIGTFLFLIGRGFSL